MAFKYPTIEELIIARCIDRAKKRGWSMRVFDGEEWYPLTANKRRIMSDVRATDESTIEFYKLVRCEITGGLMREPVGKVYFIWGNDDECISDHTDNVEMRSFVAEFTPE